MDCQAHGEALAAEHLALRRGTDGVEWGGLTLSSARGADCRGRGVL